MASPFSVFLPEPSLSEPHKPVTYLSEALSFPFPKTSELVDYSTNQDAGSCHGSGELPDGHGADYWAVEKILRAFAQPG